MTASSFRSHAAELLKFCRERGYNDHVALLWDLARHSGRRRFAVWDFREGRAMHLFVAGHGSGCAASHVRPRCGGGVSCCTDGVIRRACLYGQRRRWAAGDVPCCRCATWRRWMPYCGKNGMWCCGHTCNRMRRGVAAMRITSYICRRHPILTCRRRDCGPLPMRKNYPR